MSLGRARDREWRADLNQCLSANDAILRGRMLDDEELCWIEEPRGTTTTPAMRAFRAELAEQLEAFRSPDVSRAPSNIERIGTCAMRELKRAPHEFEVRRTTTGDKADR